MSKLIAVIGEPRFYQAVYTAVLDAMREHRSADDQALRDELAQALAELVRINEEHNAAVEAVIGRPLDWKDTYLDRARAALAKARGEA